MSPPEGGGGPTAEAASHTITISSDQTANAVKSNGAANHCAPPAHPAPSQRRREASRRLPVLDSGRSDPWHYDDGPALRGYEAAARHLLGHGLIPAPNCVALQSMWRCGGVSRRVAEVIAAAWELNA